jgi:Small metal-binding protein
MMKKIMTICAGVLLMLSSAVFAEEKHVTVALEHANAAVEAGKGNNTTGLVQHANAALEHTLAAALVLKGQAKEHMEAASTELEEAATHGQLRHTDIATEHAVAAVAHIQESNK